MNLSSKLVTGIRVRKYFIPTGKVKKISYEEVKVSVGLTKADIQQTAENEISQHVKA